MKNCFDVFLTADDASQDFVMRVDAQTAQQAINIVCEKKRWNDDHLTARPAIFTVDFMLAEEKRKKGYAE